MSKKPSITLIGSNITGNAGAGIRTDNYKVDIKSINSSITNNGSDAIEVINNQKSKKESLFKKYFHGIIIATISTIIGGLVVYVAINFLF